VAPAARKRSASVGSGSSWVRPDDYSRSNIPYQQNLTNRKLALIVLGSNIWPIVRDQRSAIAANAAGAAPGSYCFIEMPLPPKHRKDG
jgi:hypothetical protein